VTALSEYFNLFLLIKGRWASLGKGMEGKEGGHMPPVHPPESAPGYRVFKINIF